MNDNGFPFSLCTGVKKKKENLLCGLGIKITIKGNYIMRVDRHH
jgi:hypothetical protein